MRILSLISLFCFSFVFHPSVRGGDTRDLLQIEGDLDKVLNQNLSRDMSKDVTYQILARLEGWLTYSELSQASAQVLIQIFSKARRLTRGISSPWDRAFSKLISEIVPQEFHPSIPPKEPDLQINVDSLVREIQQLLSQIKTEELFRIKEAFVEFGDPEDPKSASQVLAKVASWLSSLTPARELTSTERRYLSELVSECQDRSRLAHSEWDKPLSELASAVDPGLSVWTLLIKGRLRNPVFSDLVEDRVHQVLKSGEKLTEALRGLGEPGLRNQIMDLLSEDEARSKAQISRDWRAMVHEYQKKKGYPESLLPEDRTTLEAELINASRISHAEIDSTLYESGFSGFGEFRAFAYSIHQVIIDHIRFSKVDRDASNSLRLWVGMLLSLEPHFLKHSHLGRIVREVAALENFEVLNLSNEGRESLDQVDLLAKAGNLYAQQAIAWIQELDSLGKKEQRFFQEEDRALSTARLRSSEIVHFPPSFPDFRLYLKWKEAVDHTFEKYPNGSYTQDASVARLYRKPYFRFGDTEILLPIEATHIAATKAMDRASPHERALYHLAMRKNNRRLEFPEGYNGSSHECRKEACVRAEKHRSLEASAFAQSGDFQRASSALEMRVENLKKAARESIDVFERRDLVSKIGELEGTLFVYDHLSVLNAYEAHPHALQSIISHKNEKTQNRILKNLKESHSRDQLVSRIQNLESYPFPQVANLLIESPRDIRNPLAQILALHWLGTFKDSKKLLDHEISGETNRKHPLSEVDAILTSASPRPFPEALETAAAKKLTRKLKDVVFTGQHGHPQHHLYHLPIEALITMEELGDLGGIVTQDFYYSFRKFDWWLKYAAILSKSKDFKNARLFYEKIEQGYPSNFEDSLTRMNENQLWFTQYAQAYLETGDYRNALRILAYKGEDLNFADHEFRVRALTELGEKDRLREALLARERHEHSVRLPDLRQAARIYEEDGDFVRARQAEYQASEISKRLETNQR